MEAWEEKVWERVLSREKPKLLPLLRESVDLAAAYKRLAAGGDRTFWKLYREEREAVKLLRGLMVLSGESPPPIRAMDGGRDSREKLTRSCCRRCRELARCYGEGSADPETAPVFRKLESMEQAHLLTLTAMLGNAIPAR